MRPSRWLAGAVLLSAGVLAAHFTPVGSGSGGIRVEAAAFRGQEPGGLKHRIKEDFRDSKDALHITPAVKSAVIADGQLNNRRNHINVNTKDYVVHLVGHVYSRNIKMRAGRVAAAKLAAMHKRYRVSNELTVGH